MEFDFEFASTFQSVWCLLLLPEEICTFVLPIKFKTRKTFGIFGLYILEIPGIVTFDQ